MSDTRTQLADELADIEWRDIIPHSQRDAVIVVTPSLDMLDVGMALANDEVQSVQHLISEQLIYKPSEQELSDWNGEPQKMFQALIVQPFVLIAAP
ncbi:MAG: DUF2288 domain-containing protein [Cyanobacteria bacterium P01_A01_bin.17]